MAAGDEDRRSFWHRIEEAIDEQLRTAPNHGDGAHLCYPATRTKVSGLGWVAAMSDQFSLSQCISMYLREIL